MQLLCRPPIENVGHQRICFQGLDAAEGASQPVVRGAGDKDEHEWGGEGNRLDPFFLTGVAHSVWAG